MKGADGKVKRQRRPRGKRKPKPSNARPLTEAARLEMVRALVADGKQTEFDFCPPRVMTYDDN